MKIWVKLLLGSVFGLLLGFFLPQGSPAVQSALVWLQELALRIGRYAVVPILVFSLTIAVYELRQDGIFWRLVFRLFLVLAGAAVFVIASGVMVTLFFPPARIPILIEEQLETVSLDTAGSIMDLFPPNMLSVLSADGSYLFPVCVLAFFLGLGLSYDRNYIKPVLSLFDSLSRIFYHVYSFISEILGPVMIALAASWAIRFRAALQADVFRDLIVLLGVYSVVLGFVILPLFLYLVRPKLNPWVILYGSLGPAIAAFFSGDVNFTLPVLLRHNKENLGARRRSNALTLALLATFGRVGSAMVAASAFIVIIKSYSSLEIGMMDILYIGVRAFAVSFLLARHPGDGAYTALAVLCLGYGRGFEAGYLILKPLAFYLISIGVFLDVMIAAFISCAISRVSGFTEEKSVRHFI